MEEAKAYNILNTALKSDYSALKKLFDEHNSWRQAWNKTKNDHKLDIEKEWEKLNRFGVELKLREDKDFPELLKEIPWPPFGIYIKGDFPEDIARISIVGTRKATDLGKLIAKKFAESLTVRGITIVSGLALGIDEAAHKGVVESKGKTIAVLALGLDKVYPQKNERLSQSILDFGGCLISEYPINSPSYPNRFIERNRIISGLTSGTIIIEAPEKSGALATAKFALEQNREVFVVPGPINNLNYVGSHSLLRAGARIVTSVEDILDDLNLQLPDLQLNIQKQSVTGLNEKQKSILNVLEKAGQPLDIDKISELLKIEVLTTNREITFLIIRGIVKENSGKYYI